MIFWNVFRYIQFIGIKAHSIRNSNSFKRYIKKITLNYNFCLSITPSLVNCIFIQSPVTFIALNAKPSH